MVARYAKHHLPNYSVFDEYRIFIPGDELLVLRIKGADVALIVCEDLWRDGGPVGRVLQSDASLLLVINASPFERDKDEVRLPLVTRRAVETSTTVAYVNIVGGQDDLVFDGDSVVVDPDGRILARAPQFEEHVLFVDLDLEPAGDVAPARRTSPGWCSTCPTTTRGDVDRARHRRTARRPRAALERPRARAPRLRREERLPERHPRPLRRHRLERVRRARGRRDRRRPRATASACRAAGAPTARAPTPTTSPPNIGLNYTIEPIAELVAPIENQLLLTGTAAENLQARIRGIILMGLSNLNGHLVLTTGNKTELSVGYSTIYGDSAGGFAPIKDVPKMLVWELARWRNAQAVARGETPPIPENSITKPPSAELRPDQTDQDTLPPYELLDAILDAYVTRRLGRADIVALGFDAETVEFVTRLVDRAEWKRRQGAIGPKISGMAFGRDRRLPITYRPVQ